MGTRKFRTPGSAQQSALEAAKTLMAERQKYEQWLEDLEAKKDSTPAKVYERVQKDYLGRLQNVVEQLGKYTATLEQYAESLTGKLSDLQAMEEANQEEQAEQALRKQVGELSASDWEAGSKKAQKELAKIKENQAAIEADLAQIRDLLGDGEEEEIPAPPKEKAFNELEFLSSVVGQSTAPQPAATRPSNPAAPRAATPAAAQPAPPPAAPPATPLPAPAPAATRPSIPTPAPRVSSPSSAAAPAAVPAPAAMPTAPAVSAAPTTPPAPPTAPPPAVPPEPVATVPQDPVSSHRPTVATEHAKTLKCTECGTMNYATEWYCERCGAELTGV